MQYVLFIFLIFLSIRYKKSRAVALFDAIFIWILVTFNYSRPDYSTYLFSYLLERNNGLEIGYYFVSSVFRNLGLSFNCMVGFFAFVSLSLIYLTFHRMTHNIALAMGLYMIECFPDLIQIRNFIMMSIVLYCMKFLDEKDSNQNILAYCIGVLISSTFHIIGLVYLIIPLLPKTSKKRAIILGIIGSSIIFLISFRDLRYIPKSEIYLDDFSVLWKSTLFSVEYFIYFISAIYAYESFENKMFSREQVIKIECITIYTFMYNILLFRNLNFHRIFRNIIPLLDAQYSEFFRMNQRILDVLFLLLILLCILFDFFYGLQNRLCFFKYNYFFEAFF